MTGVVFVLSSIYLTLIVSIVYTLNERGFSGGFVYQIGRRWGKFLLLLVGLGVATQLLTLL